MPARRWHFCLTPSPYKGRYHLGESGVAKPALLGKQILPLEIIGDGHIPGVFKLDE
jgi:hypothetical protein